MGRNLQRGISQLDRRRVVCHLQRIVARGLAILVCYIPAQHAVALIGSCGKSHLRSGCKACQRIRRGNGAALGLLDGHIQLLCELRGNNKRHVVYRVHFSRIIIEAYFDRVFRHVTIYHILVPHVCAFCIGIMLLPVFEIGDFPSRKGITIISRCGQLGDHITTGVIQAGHSRWRTANGLIRLHDRCRAALCLIQRNGQRLSEVRGKGNSSGRYTQCCQILFERIFGYCSSFGHRPAVKHITVLRNCLYRDSCIFLNIIAVAIGYGMAVNYYTAAFGGNIDLNCTCRHYLRDRYRHNNA